MVQYATVSDYRADTQDDKTPAEKVNAALQQQSAKLRAICGISENSKLSEDALLLARLLVVDAVRKAYAQTTLEGLGDIVGAKQASLSVDGFTADVTLQNPSGCAYFDRSTLKAFKRACGNGQVAGFVYLGGA